MELLTKKQILGADDRKTEIVDVPEWGGKVRLIAMSGEGRAAFEEAISLIDHKDAKQRANGRKFREILIAHSVVDVDGTLLFSAEDVSKLAQRSTAAIDRVFNAAAKLSAVNNGALEEAEKNSEATTTGDTSSP